MNNLGHGKRLKSLLQNGLPNWNRKVGEGEGARLNAIVGDLLSLSRAEAGARNEDVYFDIAALLEVICADARFEAEPRQVPATRRRAGGRRAPAPASPPGSRRW